MKRITAFISMLLMVAFIVITAIASGQTPQDSISVLAKIKNPCTADTVKITWLGGMIKIPINIPCPDTLFRGVYVNGTSSIVGNKVKEDALIADLNMFKINHTSHYSISSTSNPTGLANLFTRMKAETKVKTIAPAISSSSGINNWKTWNINHSDATDVDMLTLEFEPYNQTDFKTAWKTDCQYFREMDDLRKNGTIKGHNDYKGWWTSSSRDLTPLITECPDTLVKYYSINLNRLFLHDYRVAPDPKYMEKRMNDLEASGIESGKTIRVAVLFSCEPDFLQGWLKQGHTLDEAFWIVYNYFKAKNYKRVVLVGWMAFHLDFLRASQQSIALMGVRSMQAQKPVFSESNFKNKTTRKHKRLVKHLEK